MAKEKFERTKPHVNIGTIGHVDMVKLLWLLQSLKYWLKKAKLISKITAWSIKLQKNVNAVLQSTLHTLNTKLKNRHYAHVDCPGHADYVKNMITGAAQMDGAILVCSAADGPMPQTREHILLARQVGVLQS